MCAGGGSAAGRRPLADHADDLDRRAVSVARTASTSTWRKRAFGHGGLYCADAGSCTSARPPLFLIAHRPAVPSSSMPERTTPIARGPNATEAERNSASTDGRCRFSRGPRVTRTRSGLDDQVAIGRRDEDLAADDRLVDRPPARTGSRVSRCRMFGELARRVLPECAGPRTTPRRGRQAARATSTESASTPPADAPIATTCVELVHGAGGNMQAARDRRPRDEGRQHARDLARSRRCRPARRRRRSRSGCAPTGRWRCRRCV